MKKLREIFDNDLTLKCDKWEPYFDVYETYFNKFRNTKPTFVEVGVQSGGSTQMWAQYFGEGAKLYGIDIAPEVTEVDGAKIVIGDQGSEEFWDEFLEEVGEIDCFLDDGSHESEHQIVTFLKIWPHLKEGGVYICEDTHCSYWTSHIKDSMPFVEFAKIFADIVHIEHAGSATGFINSLPKDVLHVSFYNSQVVMTKGKPEFKQVIVNKK